MKKEGVLKLIVLFAVFLLLVLLTLLAIPTYFIITHNVDVNKLQNRPNRKYSYIIVDPSHNRTTSIFATIKEDLKEDEYITFEDEKGSIHIISNFGSRKYQCTGFCACLVEDEEDERRIPSSNRFVFQKGMIYLLVALTSSLALQRAKEYFSDECRSRYSSRCENHMISEVQECLPGVQMSPFDVDSLEGGELLDEDEERDSYEDEEDYDFGFEQGSAFDDFFSDDDSFREEDIDDPIREGQIESEFDFNDLYEEAERGEMDKVEEGPEGETEEQALKRYGMKPGDKRFLCQGHCMPTDRYVDAVYHGKVRNSDAHRCALYFGCEDIRKSGTCTVRKEKRMEDLEKSINFEYNRGNGPHSSMVDMESLMNDVMEEEKYAKMMFVKFELHDFCNNESWVIMKDRETKELYERTYCDGTHDLIYWENDSVECQIIFPINFDDVPDDY